MSVRRKESLFSAEVAVGGHDKNFVLPPPPEVLCKSCDMVARNPCKTQCDCRGIYCSRCSANLTGDCGVCRKPLTPINDIITAHRVSTLPVKCDNSGSGCVWIGDLGQLDCHLLSCPKQRTTCPYRRLGCAITLLRGEVDRHEETHIHRHLQLAVHHVERLESRVVVPPVVFRMGDFDRRLKLNHGWVSAPFYSHPGGYRMCLSVNVRGDGAGSRTHSSLYVCLMQGVNDEALQWPFRGEVTVQLLNQLQDGGHRQETIHFSNTSSSEVNERVRGRERSERGRGLQLFVPHSKLAMDEATNRCYLKNDALYFRVSSVVLYTSNTPWLTPSPSTMLQESK